MILKNWSNKLALMDTSAAIYFLIEKRVVDCTEKDVADTKEKERYEDTHHYWEQFNNKSDFAKHLIKIDGRAYAINFLRDNENVFAQTKEGFWSGTHE